MINTLEDIKKFLNDISFKKIFIVCGKNSFSLSGAKEVINESLINKNTKYFYKKNEIPIYEELIELIKEIDKFKPDLILAIGGGAVLDYTKVANTLSLEEDLKNKIINGSYQIKKKKFKLAAVPTTAGSGAEVTSGAVIYVDNIKYSIESSLVIPDYFFLIPEFLLSATKNIKSSSGFDAIAQATESLISMKSNDESVNYALKSLKISTKSYIDFLNNPNLKNASEMIIASNLAGKAINISKTTLPHAASYPFTNLFNISHGKAVSLFFEDFLLFNYKNISKSKSKFNLNERFNLIFKSFESNNIENFVNNISSIKKKALLNSNLDKLNVSIKSNSDKIMKGINPLRLGNNPIKISEDEIFKIISMKSF